MTDASAEKFVRLVYASCTKRQIAQAVKALMSVKQAGEAGEAIFNQWARRTILQEIEIELCGAGSGKWDDQLDDAKIVYKVLRGLYETG